MKKNLLCATVLLFACLYLLGSCAKNPETKNYEALSYEEALESFDGLLKPDFANEAVSISYRPIAGKYRGSRDENSFEVDEEHTAAKDELIVQHRMDFSMPDGKQIRMRAQVKSVVLKAKPELTDVYEFCYADLKGRISDDAIYLDQLLRYDEYQVDCFSDLTIENQNKLANYVYKIEIDGISGKQNLADYVKKITALPASVSDTDKWTPEGEYGLSSQGIYRYEGAENCNPGFGYHVELPKQLKTNLRITLSGVGTSDTALNILYFEDGVNDDNGVLTKDGIVNILSIQKLENGEYLLRYGENASNLNGYGDPDPDFALVADKLSEEDYRAMIVFDHPDAHTVSVKP